MDKWKAFFQSSGSDIWTVIDRAISIAAVEQPAEMRARRDGFTEKMFCPAAHLAGLCECDDREENGGGGGDGGARSRSDAGDEEEEEEDGDEDEEEEEETKMVVSGRGALREDDEDLEDEVEVVDDDEEKEEDDESEEEEERFQRSRKKSSGYMDVEALSDEMEEESRRIKEINRLKNRISDLFEEEDYLCEALERLESMHISFEALKATEIGRPVNNLRKHPSSRVRAIVKRLISGWKSLAEEWTKSAEHVARGGHTQGNFDGSYGLPSPPVDESELLAAGSAPLEVNKLFDFIEDDISAGSGDMIDKRSSGDWVNGIYEEAHSPEETKLTAVAGRKPEPDTKTKPASSITSSRKDGLKNTDRARGNESREKVSASAQGFRSNQGAANGKSNLSSGAGVKNQQQQKPATSNVSRLKPGVAAVSKPSSLSAPNGVQKRSIEEKIQNKGGSLSTEKLAAAKRKLHEGYKQAENAKKQRTVQVMELTDLPKGKGGPKAARAPIKSNHAQHNNRYNSNHARR